MRALVTINDGLFQMVTLKVRPFQRHLPTVTAWQLPQSRRGRGRGTALLVQASALALHPSQCPHRRPMSEVPTTLGSNPVARTTVVTWGRMRGHARLVGDKETDLQQIHSSKQQCICFGTFYGSRCEQEGA